MSKKSKQVLVKQTDSNQTCVYFIPRWSALMACQGKQFVYSEHWYPFCVTNKVDGWMVDSFTLRSQDQHVPDTKVVYRKQKQHQPQT